MNSKCKLPGYGSELMDAITQLCRFKTKLIDGTNIPNGKVLANGTMTRGFYTMLHSGEADVTLPGMSINLLRLSFGLLSFSFPIRIDYETYQYCIPISASQKTLNISINYFSQFKIDVWILIVVSILSLFATFHFLAQNRRPIQAFVRTFEHIFSGDGPPITFRKISASLLVLIMFSVLFGSLIKCHYTTVLVSSGVSFTAVQYHTITDRETLGKALLNGSYRLVVLRPGSGMQNAVI